MQRDVRGILSRLPKTLDETYERVLRDIHDDNKEHARRLLHCLAVAVRPLRVEELAEILAFDFDAAKGGIPEYHADWRWKDQDEAVLSTCSSLITIAEYNGFYGDSFDGSMRVVQFSHFTVKEFLMADRLATPTRDVSQYHIRPEPAHTILAQACLGFLLHLDGCIGKERVKDFPLAKYAAENWVAHAQIEDVASHVKHGIKDLFDPERPYFASWIGTRDMDVRFRQIRLHQQTRPTPLYYSALYGFYEIVKDLSLKYPQYANAIGGKYDFPLLAALSEGHIKVAELLIEHGGDVNAHGTRRRTQLYTLLLNSYLFEDYRCSVQFLLKHGADPNLVGEDGKTPLHILLFGDLHRYRELDDILPVARLLLEHGADPNLKSKDCEIPLHMILFSDLRSPSDVLPVAQLLLEHGADPNLKGKDGETSLHILLSGKLRRRSASNVRVLVGQLLNHGADPNLKGKDGETPLHVLLLNALHHRYSTDDILLLAHLLLEHGADPNLKGKDGETPLHILLFSNLCYGYYSTNDVLQVARLLLNHGADTNLKSKDSETPLHLLLFSDLHHRYHSTDDVLLLAQLLLEHGADPNTNTEGKTPLQILLGGCQHFLSGRCPNCYHDDTVVMKLLPEHGADVALRDKSHETSLRLALRHEASNTVRCPLDHGADPDSEHEKCKTPLQILSGPQHSRCSLCSYSHRPDHIFVVVQSLLEHGADVNARDNAHKTPLHLAIQHGTSNIVLFLLEHGADPNMEDSEGNTPLHTLLIKREIDEDDKDSDVLILQFLLKLGTDTSARNKNRLTPLDLAPYYGKVLIAQMLLCHAHVLEGEYPQQHCRCAIHLQ